MAKEYSGYKKVEYSIDAGFTAPVDLGTPLNDGTFESEIGEVETAKGVMLYAGKRVTYTANITDLTKFSALETIMKDDTPIWVRVTKMDATTEILVNEGLCKVKKNSNFAVNTLNTFEFKVSGFGV